MSYKGKKKDYWKTRIANQNERDIQRTWRENAKELDNIYKYAKEELAKEIVLAYTKIQEDLGTTEGLMINDLYRTKRYWDLLDYFNSLGREIGQKELVITEQAILDTYNMAQQAITEYLPRDMIRSAFVNAKGLDPQRIIRQAWCEDGKNFSDRIWLNKDKLMQDLRKTLTETVALGRSPWQVADEMSKRFDTSEYNAFRLMRTETAHFQTKAAIDKYKTYGFTQGRYLGTNCCGDCHALNGQVFPLDELENLLPNHPNCTCTFELVIPND